MSQQDKTDLINVLMFTVDSFDHWGFSKEDMVDRMGLIESEAQGYLDSLERLKGPHNYASIFTREFWESKLSQ